MKNFKRLLTSPIIALGSGNTMVRLLIGGRCRQSGVTAGWHETFMTLTKGRREIRIAPEHFIYAPDMSQRFDMYFSPLVPKEIDGKLVLDYSRPGILQTYAKSGLEFEMCSFPEEDEAIESYFHWYRPGPGDTVFDIGAHCGVSTYHFSKLVGPTGRVFSFEPDPVSFAMLLRNIERHGLKNVTPLPIAIAGSRGEAAFNCEHTLASGLMRHSTRTSVGTVTMVKTVTLEDAFKEWGSPQFCKIDVEGAEIEIISAAREFLAGSDCQFALDTSHVMNGMPTNQRIESLFDECGYRSSTSDDDTRTTWACHARA